MTTNIKLRTNGNYVAEIKDTDDRVYGKAGPGNNVESDWISFPHGRGGISVTEREATAEEIAAANKPAEGEQNASE